MAIITALKHHPLKDIIVFIVLKNIIPHNDEIRRGRLKIQTDIKEMRETDKEESWNVLG